MSKLDFFCCLLHFYGFLVRCNKIINGKVEDRHPQQQSPQEHIVTLVFCYHMIIHLHLQSRQLLPEKHEDKPVRTYSLSNVVSTYYNHMSKYYVQTDRLGLTHQGPCRFSTVSGAMLTAVHSTTHKGCSRKDITHITRVAIHKLTTFT